MPISEVQNNYKIGYFASAFIRVNFSRHFLQPEVTYSINRSSITFSDPILSGAPSASIMGQAELTSSMHCIEIPVLYGYHIIKEDFYSLAVFGGPNSRALRQRDVRQLRQTGTWRCLATTQCQFYAGSLGKHITRIL